MTEQKEPTSPKTKSSPRYSREEGLALFDRWKASGLSLSKFCQKHGLSENRLRYWADVARQLKKAKTSRSKEFFVIDAPENGTQSSGKTQPAASNPTGKAVIVVVPAADLGQTLRAVVQELGL